jgi:hypothetical protein
MNHRETAANDCPVCDGKGTYFNSFNLLTEDCYECARVTRLLSQVEQESAPKWIPVEERLPKAYDSELRSRIVSIAIAGMPVSSYGYYSHYRKLWFDTMGVSINGITHWAEPLTPPQAKGHP